jgi:hypothetical protein
MFFGNNINNNKKKFMRKIIIITTMNVNLENPFTIMILKLIAKRYIR